ncbi:hypothetical protein Droror1_Dr00017842, partial [Drosera rotundifolia]
DSSSQEDPLLKTAEVAMLASEWLMGRGGWRCLVETLGGGDAVVASETQVPAGTAVAKGVTEKSTEEVVPHPRKRKRMVKNEAPIRVRQQGAGAPKVSGPSSSSSLMP